MNSLPIRAVAATALLAVLVVPARAQTAADSSAIVATALNYLEGFYEANPARMESALHPDLAKRIVQNDPQGRSHLGQMSALTLVQYSRDKDPTPPDRRQQDVTILDVYGNSASVKAIAHDWVDYMHMAKWNGEWKIVNVLWEMKPHD